LQSLYFVMKTDPLLMQHRRVRESTLATVASESNAPPPSPPAPAVDGVATTEDLLNERAPEPK
jgi:hypothetical protein